jgi:hypothetical protein
VLGGAVAAFTAASNSFQPFAFKLVWATDYVHSRLVR